MVLLNNVKIMWKINVKNLPEKMMSILFVLKRINSLLLEIKNALKNFSHS